MASEIKKCLKTVAKILQFKNSKILELLYLSADSHSSYWGHAQC